MLMWSYYIIDYGALTDDPFQEYDTGVPRLFWASAEQAQVVAEREINARLDSTGLFEEDKDGRPCVGAEPKPEISWRTAERESDKIFEWGSGESGYGFLVTIFPVTMAGVAAIEWQDTR